LTLLEQILLGNAASPLRKALIDSQLGAALCDGCGYDAENRDTLFVCGLKDMDASDAVKLESIILEELHGLAEGGIDPQMIEAAIHQIEFHRKEITNTPYPFGIKLLMSFAGSWIHGGDPVRILNFDADLNRIKTAVSEGPFFEGMIRRYFLENPHRIRMTLEPDPDLERERENRLQQRLEQEKKQLRTEDIHNLLTDAEALQRLQDADEDVSSLPTLEREDIPPAVHVVSESDFDPAARLAVYRQKTSGIAYFAAAAGSGRVPADLLWLIPFFCHALSRIGTSRRDYTEMARRIDSRTGGLGFAVQARIPFGLQQTCMPFVTVNAKCLNRNQSDMHDILQELAREFDFSDRTRIRHLLLEYRSALESMVIRNGHRLAISLAARNYHTARGLGERWSGIHQLQAIRQAVDTLSDPELDTLCERLERIGRLLFARPNLKAAVIGEEGAVTAGGDMARKWMAALDASGGEGFAAPEMETGPTPVREGWSTTTAVSFVAAVFPTVRMEHADAPALALISKMLRSMYLHREIREKGGAYGGFALYNPEDGLFGFASYRDPHVVSTLNVFESAAGFIRSGDFDDEDVKEAILQVCSEIDKPDPPGPAARKAFYRKIIHFSDELRQDFKRRLLALDRLQVRRAAETYFGPQAPPPSVAVISSKEKLTAANRRLGAAPLELLQI
jgi:Zn-dependent M16 (insulinase) family peptidase